jgi:hypothetical protein
MPFSLPFSVPFSLPFSLIDGIETHGFTHGGPLLHHAGRNSRINVHAVCERECVKEMNRERGVRQCLVNPGGTVLTHGR